MIEAIFLLAQKVFRLKPHPFNEKREGKLNYSNFEYAGSEPTFDLFSGYCDFKKQIRSKNVLDVACGGGGKSVWIAERGAKSVTGVDLEPLFVEQSIDFAKKKKMSSVCKFVLGDASDLPLKDSLFDAVVLNDVMEHVDKPEDTLKECSRVLKKGGLIYINMEPYYHPNGSHMMDVFTMPWNHLFFTEKFRIKMYKKMVADLPDGDERVNFRISKDENGDDYVGYLNKMTVVRFEKVISGSAGYGLKPAYLEQKLFSRFPMRYLGRLPFFREIFTRYLVVVLRKE